MNNKSASPRTMWSGHHNNSDTVNVPGLNMIEYACIKLKVPKSGNKELDDLIRESRRMDILKTTMNGVILNIGRDAPEFIIDLSIKYADTLIKKLDGKE